MPTAPVWKANGVAAGGAGAITVNAPSGHAVGDFLLLAINTSAEPSGGPGGSWVSLGGNTNGAAATASSAGLDVFYKFAETTTESASIGDSGNHTLGVITSFTGVSTVRPVQTTTTAAFNTLSVTASINAVTTTNDNSLVVGALSFGQDGSPTAFNFSGLDSPTIRATGSTTAGIDGGVAMGSGTKVTAGDTGSGSFTWSQSARAVTMTVVLNPVEISQNLVVTGIASAQALGEPSIVQTTTTQNVVPPGIASAQAMGSPTVLSGAVTRQVTSIASAEVVSPLQNVVQNQTVVAAGVASAETFGGLIISQTGGGPSTVALLSISSAEAFGAPVVRSAIILAVTGIPSTELFGAPLVFFPPIPVPVTGIASAEAFGTPVMVNPGILPAVTELFDVVTFTGDGSFPRTIPHGVDLSSGGLVMVYPAAKDGATEIAMAWYGSENGSEVYRETNSSAGAAATATTTFANGSITFTSATDAASAGYNFQNVAGVPYVVYVFRKHAKFLGIKRYVGDDAATRAIPHGLSFTPGLYGAMNRSFRFTDMPNGDILRENDYLTAASGSYFDAPTSTDVIVKGGQFGANNPNIAALGYVIFAFAAQPVSSQRSVVMTSYVGNGSSTGPLVDLGWHPQALLVFQNTFDAFNAVAFDTARSSHLFAGTDARLGLNYRSPLEQAGEFLAANSTGFQLTSSDASVNTSGQTYYVLALRSSVAFDAAFVAPTGISSAGAFGTPTLLRGASVLQPPSIGSTEAFGAPTILRGTVTVSPSGIASGQAVGNPTVLRGGVVVAPTGIASAQAFGSPTISSGAVTISVAGIASAEIFGSPLVSTTDGVQTVITVAIDSSEAFGGPTIATAITVAPVGIPSAQALGSPTLLRGAVTVSPAGIASAQAFGVPTLQPGITSVVLTGIASGFVVGSPTVLPGGTTVLLTGVASSEAFGVPSLQAGAVLVAVASIGSAEAFGAPSFTSGGAIVAPTGVASGEAFGTPTLTTITYVAPASVTSAEALGNPTVIGASAVELFGVSSGEAFGTPTVLQPKFALVNSITSGETFGTPSMLAGARAVPVDGILSDEQFGAVSITTSTAVQPNGIPSGETFGGITLVPGQAWLEVLSIGSEEAFGFIYIAGGARPQIPVITTRPSASGPQVLQPSDDATALRVDDDAIALRPSAKKRVAYRPNKDSS